jgi:hypothetical protein
VTVNRSAHSGSGVSPDVARGSLAFGSPAHAGQLSKAADRPRNRRRSMWVDRCSFIGNPFLRWS